MKIQGKQPKSMFGQPGYRSYMIAVPDAIGQEFERHGEPGDKPSMILVRLLAKVKVCDESP